jgi:SSS family solute:Na+ symporter
MLGSTLFLLMRLFWMAVIIYATTWKVLVPVTGVDPSWTPYLAALMGVVTLVYTTMGGLRAVVVTDVIQTLILFAGAALTIVVITLHFGGVRAWWPQQWPTHWSAPEFWFGSITGTRLTFLSAMASQFTWWTCTAASDQMAIQRYLATRDATAARHVLLTSLLSNCFVYLLLGVTGMALLAVFLDRPGLLLPGQSVIENADALFPRFIAVGLPAGISGAVVAGLLAAAMSSLSSGVNSSCSVITVDYLDRLRPAAAPRAERQRVRRARLISVLIGIVVVGLSTLVGLVQGNLLEVAFKVVNLLTVPLAGLFFMAMFVRWATTPGVWIGAAAGLAVVVLLNYWPEIAALANAWAGGTVLPSRGISLFWAMPLALVAEMLTGCLASLAVGQPRPAVAVEP